jgi:hypothetical protein
VVASLLLVTSDIAAVSEDVVTSLELVASDVVASLVVGSAEVVPTGPVAAP